MQDADGLLAGMLKSPRYVAFKKFVTLSGSLILGITVSSSSHFGLFNEYKFPINKELDIILTGITIGAGAEPVHQLINSLQSARDAISGLAGLLQGSALKQAAAAQLTSQTPAVSTPPPAVGLLSPENSAANIARLSRLIKRT